MPQGTGPPEGRFRAPLWVGEEPLASSGGDLWENLASYNEEAPNAPTYTDEQVAAMNDRPVPVAAGPFEFSTTQELERWPTIIWDVNGYYRELGVLPKATRAELKRAYQDMNGEGSVRLTHIFRQLLDPEIRAAYDASKPGSVFFDETVAQWFHEQTLNDSIKEEGRLLTLDERIERGQQVLDLSEYMNKPYDLVDKPEEEDLLFPWRWGYYLWRTYVHDLKLLAKWQALLLTAPTQKPSLLAIGLLPENDPASVRFVQIGLRTVAFIRVNLDPTVYHAIACLLSPIEVLAL